MPIITVRRLFSIGGLLYFGGGVEPLKISFTIIFRSIWGQLGYLGFVFLCLLQLKHDYDNQTKIGTRDSWTGDKVSKWDYANSAASFLAIILLTIWILSKNPWDPKFSF